MNIAKILSLSTVAASLLVLVGCTSVQTKTSTNTNVVANTNTTDENANIEVVTDVNETVSNENTNTDQGSGVDTSDWQTYDSGELALSFSYPKLNGQVDYFTSNCDDNECFSGKIIGWKYTGNEALPRKYTLAAAVTENFGVDRETWPTDYPSFIKEGDQYTLNYSFGNKDVKIEQGGDINGQLYIIYKFDSLDPSIDDSLREAYIAMVQFPVGYNSDFQNFTIYFEHPSSIEEVIASVESIQFE